MKKTLFLFTMLLMGLSTMAKPVDVALARQVAINFWNAHRDKGVAAVSGPLTLISSEFDAFYIFANGGQGFVIVAADDCVQPVLAYSFSSPASENINPEVRYWLSTWQREIDWMRANGITNAEYAHEWTLYSTATQGDPVPLTAVSPLLTTTWDQSPYYNNLCPYDNVEHDRAVTGCVATATAQVMKYWNHPAQGTGSHSYVEDDYGTLSANFGNTTYQWNQMPSALSGTSSTAQVNAVATLMYHVGVAIEMDYGVEGSGAQMTNYGYSYSEVPSPQDALPLFFGYTDSIAAVYRDLPNMTDAQWKAYVKNELDASRPVLYSGYDSTGGHCFVCDGYNVTETQFHFNWGWSGYYDGFFTLNNLTLTGGGTGSTATYSFNIGQQILINVHPANGGSGGGGITPDPNCLIMAFPYTETFDDTATYSCLRLIDANGDGQSWSIIDSFGTNYSRAAYIMYAEEADDYLILPGITAPGSYSVSWVARAYQSSYPETYQVLAGNDVIFSETLSATSLTARTATFSVTDGDTVSIMFRYLSDDMYAFFLDDITIDTASVTPPTPPTPEEVCLITAFPYTETFDDTATYSCLRLIDANGDGQSWSIIDSFGTNYSRAAYIMYAEEADDYLILPGITAPGSYSVSWVARAYQSSYPETYQVLAGNDVIFSETLSATSLTARTATFTVTDGDTVNIMFRYLSDDMYAFFLDDITITTATEPNPPVQYTLTVLSSNDAYGTVTGGGTYDVGTTVTLTATPNSGYHFVQWQDGNTSATRTVTVTADATYIATFAQTVGVEEVEKTEVIIEIAGRTLSVSNPGGDAVSVYDIAGRQLVTSHLSSFTFQIPAFGVYIVADGKGMVKKLIVE